MTDLFLYLLPLVGGLGVLMMSWSFLLPPRVRLKKDLEGLRPADVPAVERPTGLMGRIQANLDRAGIEMTAAEFLRTGGLIGLAIGAVLLVLSGQPILLVAGVGVGYAGYWMVLAERKQAFVREYRDALATAVDIIRNTFAATPSISIAVQNIVNYGPPILRDDFARVSALLSAGASFEEAMAPVQARRQDLFLDQMVEALGLREHEGASVTQLLNALSEAIRAQGRIFRDMMAEQKKARLEAVIVSLSPIAFYLLMSVIMPGYREFYRTLLGQVILLAIVLLSAGGYYLQNKLGTMGMDIEQVMK
ncbi:MAG TPA: hypothetical protein EYH30_06700 [Anaerolineales bacterium]|nr:hypothetical protein [Anaerolineales bacterium]